MRMKPVDVNGSLYSERGLRFGGFQTTDFFMATEQLEAKQPGIRERIIAEAHYLCSWLDSFPEIAFLFGIVYYGSLGIPLLLFAGAYIFEIIRFYAFGASPFLSRMCRFWDWIRIPSFLIAAIGLFPQGWFVPIALIVFLIVQGWLGLVTNIGMFPIRIIAMRIVFKRLGIHWANIEGMAMNFVINYWRQDIFPDEFTIRDE